MHDERPLRWLVGCSCQFARLATDLATEHGGTDANQRDAVRQLGWLNTAGLHILNRSGESGDFLI